MDAAVLNERGLRQTFYANVWVRSYSRGASGGGAGNDSSNMAL